jgi:DNA-binding NarL/FixJ family response regulator
MGLAQAGRSRKIGPSPPSVLSGFEETIAVQRGKKMGRPTGTVESPREFLNKPRNREIIGYLNRGLSYSEIARLMDCSKNTVCKVKALMTQLDSPLNA